MKLSPLVITTVAAALSGCGAAYESLGTWYVDDPRAPLVTYDDDRVDTVATLSWGDSLEVLAAPAEDLLDDNHLLVRHGELVAMAPRDLLISDLLFRSKYAHGRPIHVASDGRRFFIDEFGDSIVVSFRREAAMPRDTVVRREAKKPAKPAKAARKKKGRR